MALLQHGSIVGLRSHLVIPSHPDIHAAFPLSPCTPADSDEATLILFSSEFLQVPGAKADLAAFVPPRVPSLVALLGAVEARVGRDTPLRPSVDVGNLRQFFYRR